MAEPKRGPRQATAGLAHAYRVANWVALGLAVYCLLLPLISPVMGRLLPGIWGRCAYQEMTGRPCPLCGLTRAFKDLARGDVGAALGHHRYALVFAAAVMGEAAFRALVLAMRPDPRRSVVVKADVGVHGILLVLYVVYVVAAL